MWKKVGGTRADQESSRSRMYKMGFFWLWLQKTFANIINHRLSARVAILAKSCVNQTFSKEERERKRMKKVFFFSPFTFSVNGPHIHNIKQRSEKKIKVLKYSNHPLLLLRELSLYNFQQCVHEQSKNCIFFSFESKRTIIAN